MSCLHLAMIAVHVDDFPSALASTAFVKTLINVSGGSHVWTCDDVHRAVVLASKSESRPESAQTIDS